MSEVSLSQIARHFLFLGSTTLGGGVVAHVRERVVERLGWMDDEEFLVALEISQTLPGLNAVNLSIVVGEKLRGSTGAALASACMVLPGALILSVLGALTVHHADDPHLRLALGGVAASACGLLFTTTLRVGEKQLRSRQLVLVILTVLATSVWKVPLPLLLATLGPLSVWLARPRA
jgi:chromate transporter